MIESVEIRLTARARAVGRTAGLAWRVGGLALLLAAGAAGGCGAPRAPEAAPAVSHAAIGFRSHELLVEHYEKHGREFGSVSMSEYLQQAQALRDGSAGGVVEEIVRDDGVTTRFDRRTGAFIAFDRDGVIRTFFKPRDGERYFRRQATRSEAG
jgi:hypothetical protein